MAKATRVCSICGKEYPYCKTFRKEGVFRWQEVACCQEHGAQYFAEVLAARSASQRHNEPAQANDITVEPPEQHDMSSNEDDTMFGADSADDNPSDEYWYEEEFKV